MKIFAFLLFSLFSANLFAIPVTSSKLANVTFTRLNFVYMEAQGTIKDTFEEERNMVTNHVLQYGIVAKRTVILYLDSYGSDQTSQKDYDKNQKDYAELMISKGIVVSKDLKFDISEEYLIDNFGTSYLNINRKVLVGVLIFPNISITPTSEIKTINFSNMVLPTYQSVMPLDEESIPYSIYDRIYDRTAIINYINLEPSKYVGMMEIYDDENKVFTFSALVGNKEEFIRQNNIRGLVPGANRE